MARLLLKASATERLAVVHGPGTIGNSENEAEMVLLGPTIFEIILTAGQQLYVTGDVTLVTVAPCILAVRASTAPELVN